MYVYVIQASRQTAVDGTVGGTALGQLVGGEGSETIGGELIEQVGVAVGKVGTKEGLEWPERLLGSGFPIMMVSMCLCVSLPFSHLGR